METETIAIVSAFACAWLVLLIVAIVLCVRVGSLRQKLDDIASGKLRVQKLKIEDDKNHAFRNPNITPDEELSRRGYSMYVGGVGAEDIESGRGTERQTGGQFVEDLQREIESRQHRQTAPPFLLNGIEDNKRRNRSLNNPAVKQSRPSETNPNFIY